MSDPKEEIWSKAFFAYLGASLDPSAARQKADEATSEYADRWPHSEHIAAVPSGVDLGMFARVVAQLEADRRVDAHTVLRSLCEAMSESQRRGERLTRWTPPARGS